MTCLLSPRDRLRLFEAAWLLDSLGRSPGTPARAGEFRRTLRYEEERRKFEALRERVAREQP